MQTSSNYATSLQSPLAPPTQDELGWSPRGQTRRIVMVMTDGDYHYALDGKVIITYM